MSQKTSGNTESVSIKKQKLQDQYRKSTAYLKHLPFILVVLTIVYCADEITSSINGVMRPYMIFDLFQIPGASAATGEYASAISKMAVATIPTYIITALLPLYKTLSDKYGRKIFLVINTIGMGVGLFICMTAPNYILYILGTVVFGFFTPNDMQVIYLMETAPKERRATLCSITKGLGLLSVSLIGVLRSIFYNPEELSTWRLVFLVPVILAVSIGVVCALTLKETPAFLERKIQSLDQKETSPQETKSSASSGGLKSTVRFMFHDRQLKVLMLSLVLFEAAVALTGYGPETMLAWGQSDDNMNLFYIVEPIVYAVCAFFSGFLTDRIGRRRSGIAFGMIALVFEILFVVGARLGLNPWILAVTNGIMYGGLWSFSDLLFIVVPSESAPTEIRASVVGLLQYTAITNILVTLLVGILYQFIGSANIGLLQLVIFVPCMILVLIFVSRNLRETQGVEMNQAGRSGESS